MSDFTHVYICDVGGVDLHYDLRSNCRQMSQITSVHVAAFKPSAVSTLSNQTWTPYPSQWFVNERS